MKALTVNPAGSPTVRQKDTGSYTHKQFVRDVKKLGKPKRDAR